MGRFLGLDVPELPFLSIVGNRGRRSIFLVGSIHFCQGFTRFPRVFPVELLIELCYV